MDRELSEKENKLRNREMRSLLAEEELDYSELVGSSPDGSHQEPSFAVSCKLEDAIDWANRFEQRAIFWIEENQLQIIASENGDRFQLGPFRERIREIQIRMSLNGSSTQAEKPMPERELSFNTIRPILMGNNSSRETEVAITSI